MIRAVGRALAIFDAFDNEHLSLSLQEIAERIRMPKTTAFRLVATLERAGFLIRMDNQQYCLSLKVARLGGLVRSTLNVRDIARPVMLEVNEKTQETITLNTVVDTDRMVLEVVDTPSPLMSMARLGQHMPLFLGASSRIILAHMETAEVDRVLKVTAAGRKDFDRAAFDRELARFRKQGYALSRGQRVPGLTAISVPLFDIKGDVRHSLALTGPSVRVDPRDHDLAEIMMAAGREISTRLGASPEHAIDLKLLLDETSGEKAVPAKKRAAKTVKGQRNEKTEKAAKKPARRMRKAANEKVAA